MKSSNLLYKKREVLDLESLDDDTLLSYTQGGEEIVISKDQLLYKLRGDFKPTRDKRKNRKKEHNQLIGISQSFTALWKSYEDNDTDKAKRILDNAVGKYGTAIIKEIYTQKLENKSGRVRNKILNLLGKL